MVILKRTTNEIGGVYMEKVTVLGAGTMGHGIAQIYAQAGYKVFLI